MTEGTGSWFYLLSLPTTNSLAFHHRKKKVYTVRGLLKLLDIEQEVKPLVFFFDIVAFGD